MQHELKGTVRRGGGKDWKRRVQYTANQGLEWTSIRTTTQEGDFQVSKGVKLIYRQRSTEEGVSNKKESQGVLRTCAFDTYVYTNKSCVEVINKPCVREARYMR
jgi:hypothetical protein